MAVRATIANNSIIFVNTHLEVREVGPPIVPAGFIQAAQAFELTRVLGALNSEYPEVPIIVANQTNGRSSGASIAYNPKVREETFYLWSASVSLAAGDNRVVARADDGGGNQGSDALRVNKP